MKQFEHLSETENVVLEDLSVHLLQYWSNVSQTTFDNATNFIQTFNSVNSNYSNQGGVNTNITCN